MLSLCHVLSHTNTPRLVQHVAANPNHPHTQSFKNETINVPVHHPHAFRCFAIMVAASTVGRQLRFYIHCAFMVSEAMINWTAVHVDKDVFDHLPTCASKVQLILLWPCTVHPLGTWNWQNMDISLLISVFLSSTQYFFMTGMHPAVQSWICSN